MNRYMEGAENWISSASNINEDRLSSLSDDLLHLIMSFLNTLLVVRTCILSKRWKNVWKTLPYLDFKLSEFKIKRHTHTHTHTQPKIGARERFKDFVSMTLLHRADINVHRFHLSLYSSPYEHLHIRFIRNWIRYVIEHHPREFHYVIEHNPAGEFHAEGACILLPIEIFTCSSLEDVCMPVLDVPDIINLPNLRRLHLKCIRIYQDFVERLLGGCPLLQELNLRGCLSEVSNICCKSLKSLQIKNECHCWLHRSIPRTTINTPNLQSFEYKGCAEYIGNTMLVRMSSLCDGSFDLDLYGSFPRDRGMSEITDQLSNVQNYKLCCILLKDLFQRELPFFPKISELKSLSVNVSLR